MRVISAIYRFLWSHTTGRPWTYVTRAWTKNHVRESGALAGPVAVLFLIGQVAVTMYLHWWALLLSPVFAFAFFTAGHIFWWTKQYIPRGDYE